MVFKDGNSTIIDIDELEDIYSIRRKENVLLIANYVTDDIDMVALSEMSDEAVNHYEAESYAEFIPALIEEGLIR